MLDVVEEREDGGASLVFRILRDALISFGFEFLGDLERREVFCRRELREKRCFG